MYKKILTTSLVICFCNINETFANTKSSHQDYQIQEEKTNLRNENFDKVNTISFYSGYIDNLYTNQNLANFGLELANLGNLGMYKITNCSRNIFLNSSIGIFTGFFALYSHIIHNVAYHELGHALRVKAFGLNYDLSLQRYKNVYRDNCTKNFFIFFIKNFFLFGMDGCTPHESIRLTYNYNKINNSILTLDKIIISAGGTNNSMYLAERNFYARHENKLNKNLFTNIAYLGEKLEPFIYLFFFSNGQSGDDFSSLLSHYADSNIKVSRSHYKIAETISLLSGLINSSVELFLYDKFNETFQRIIFPDVFVYSTSYGLSYKFVTGFKFREMSLVRVGWEHVMHGENKNEISLGVFHRFDHTMKPEASGTISFGYGGMNLETSFAFSLLKHLRLSAGFNLYATRSLFGERHATKILDIKEVIKESLDAEKQDKTISEKQLKDKFLKNKYCTNLWAGISFAF